MPHPSSVSDTAQRGVLIRAAEDMVPMLRERAQQTDAERRILLKTEKAFTNARCHSIYRNDIPTSVVSTRGPWDSLLKVTFLSSQPRYPLSVLSKSHTIV